MSLFTRLFRKAPPPPQSPASVPLSEPPRTAPKVPAEPAVPDRTLAVAEEKALEAAIAAQDVPAIARLVTAGASTKIRQRAAQSIEDPEVLRQLIRDVRGGNDKSVYKILTSKRDALL